MLRMLFETFPQGYEGRWTFGAVILVYLISYNESCGPTIVFSNLLASFYAIFSATCKSAIKHVQIPYIRAGNKFDFSCLFLALWMDVFTILAACGVLARTLSICLDTMTGGLVRILILGRNSSPYEPWPDVLGVAVVFLLTAMFMLGLENTKIFSVVMMFGMFGVNLILTIVSWIHGNYSEWEKDIFRPDGLKSFFVSAALITFAYPSEIPKRQGWKKIFGWLLILVVCLSNLLICACLSMIVTQKSNKEYSAVPFFIMLDESNYQNLISAAACLLLLASSGIFLEFFTEMYNIIVRLATSEWKILLKQISYESPDSGNPILAIFIAGSLCAMLAFACPLQILTHILAASHLCSGLFRAFYLLYVPFRPKFIQQSNNSALSYSRLTTTTTTSRLEPSKRKSTWNLNFPTQKTIKNSRSKTFKRKKEVEKEWLLLGEPSSPSPRTSQIRTTANTESTVFSDVEIPMSDNEFVDNLQNTDSDSSTDIDAIVDEYRQKIKVTTAGPIEKCVRLPTIISWRITIFAILVIIFGIGLTILGIYLEIVPVYVTGSIGIIIVSIMMSFIPKYSESGTYIAPIVCIITLALGSFLLSFCLSQSWPAILFWILIGLVLVIRCDKKCCSCLDQPGEELISSISGKTAFRISRQPSKAYIAPTKIHHHHHHHNHHQRHHSS